MPFPGAGHPAPSLTLAARRDETEGASKPPNETHLEVDEMAEERRENKCARETCGCQAEQGSKYCSEECENASKNISFEISCTCHHPDCK